MAIIDTENDSGSGSDSDQRSSRSPSPSSRSGSASPAQGSRSPSRSPQAGRAQSVRSISDRSRSPTPKSGSASPQQGSPKSGRSRSGSAKSGSPNSGRSRSGSANSNRSKSGSPKSTRSRSGSAKSNRSRSGSAQSASPKSGRSPSGTPKSNQSGSPKSQRSNRSRSSSPKAVQSGHESDEEATKSRGKHNASSDGSDAEKEKKVKSGSVASGDENLVIDAEALFGDASDISDDDEAKKEKEKPEEVESDDDKQSEAAGSTHESQDESKTEQKKEAAPDEPIPETRIDVEIPKIEADLGDQLFFVKLPNFLSIETRPFDPDTYEDEIDEEETLDEEGRARLKLKVENTIRWREIQTPEGLKRESNARFVKWSDGSMTFHLGAEVFDVHKQPLQGDHNHLFIRQGTGLQGQAVFRTKLSFRPHSTESFTHRKMTMSLADRSMKTPGVKLLSLVGKDPEANRSELIRKEEEKLRATVRRESRQKRVREKGAGRSLSAGYLEPDRFDVDSDEEAISINAIKKSHKDKASSKSDRPKIYSTDEDGSDIETRRARRLDKAKALKDSDDDESNEDKKSSDSDD